MSNTTGLEMQLREMTDRKKAVEAELEKAKNALCGENLEVACFLQDEHMVVVNERDEARAKADAANERAEWARKELVGERHKNELLRATVALIHSRVQTDFNKMIMMDGAKTYAGILLEWFKANSPVKPVRVTIEHAGTDSCLDGVRSRGYKFLSDPDLEGPALLVPLEKP